MQLQNYCAGFGDGKGSFHASKVRFVNEPVESEENR